MKLHRRIITIRDKEKEINVSVISYHFDGGIKIKRYHSVTSASCNRMLRFLKNPIIDLVPGEGISIEQHYTGRKIT